MRGGGELLTNQVHRYLLRVTAYDVVCVARKLSETEDVRVSLELRSELVLSGLASTPEVTRVADSSR